MAETLRHRGPDGHGSWAAGHVGLAQRRLAVIDLSPTGRQPMRSASARWVVVFNGEIYNHLELRAELARSGITFRGTSDTETLVEAIDAWGLVEALRRCNGMFAVAAYDTAADCLHLARDRCGEKPLYWCRRARTVYFASELRGVRVAVPGTLDIDEQSVAALLRWSFIPHPFTIYRDVFQLPPGGLLTIDAEGAPRQSLWWDLDAEIARARGSRGNDPGGAVARLSTDLREAVRQRLISDVPLGAFLSGGIDSGLVAAFAQEALGAARLRTFTVTMPELEADEGIVAQRVASALGTDHETLELGRAEAFELVRSMPTIWDEPFGDPSMLPTAMMCRAVRGHVTVCLSGDGGDELFAGYNRHVFGLGLARRSASWPAPLRRALSGAARHAPGALLEPLGRVAGRVPHTALRSPNLVDKIRKAGHVLHGGQSAWAALAGLWAEADLGSIPHPPSSGVPDDDLDAVLRTDLASVVPDQMMVKVDRASMASSLEVRVPMLDPRVMDIAWSLPADSLAKGGVGKLPLRRVAADVLPADVVHRAKHGFDPPLAQWLRAGLRPWADELVAGSEAVRRGWVSAESVRTTWADHRSGRRNHEHRLWPLLMLEAWLDAGAGRPTVGP